MQNKPFKIYNASAGSGKTFTLAKSYLKILIASNDYNKFRSILALTFTNKAVGEMKERIIMMLKVFSTKENLDNPHPMFIDICKDLSIAKADLNTKSKQILKHIIHNYGAFDISTIDGFTHRVIRTFAHDLKLPVNFEVELDQERLLSEAVDSLIAKAGTDKELTKILVDFAIEKADDDKSWDISYDFNKISKLLVNENDSAAIKILDAKTIEEFQQLKIQLAKDIETLEKAIVSVANSTLDLIEESGLQFDDFNRKSLPKHFESLASKTINLNFSSAWQADLIEGNSLYPARVSDANASTIESIQPYLAEAFIKSKTSVFELKLKKGFYKNMTPLSVLNAIQKEVNAIKNEQNKMLISEFNTIIGTEIKDQPTPFIYERLGEKFKHYFIDEFQDTSKMQWENLVPLLDNALSTSSGSAMLVGDAKQAIYRWRGGEAEQFINLYNLTENPFPIEAQVLPLETNYRSAKSVITFNNAFFKFLSGAHFSNTVYANLYQNSRQNLHSTTQGYVNLNFLDIKQEDDNDQRYAQQTLDTVKQCQENGYKLEDICVIVRKRKQGVVVAKYLSEHGITITSSETLLLKNSDKVIFLNAFLKLLLQPTNKALKIEVLTFLAEQHCIEDKHQFFALYINKEINAFFESLEALQIFTNKEKLLQLPLYELIEELIRVFKLNTTSDAYLQFYLDFVLEFTQNQNTDLSAFLRHFEKKEDNLSVVSPENRDAVRIMTIHKSKGLEFSVVIFPFADLNIYRELEPKVWFPLAENTYHNFKTLLINYNKDVEHFGDEGKSIYNKHQAQLELDNINLLYVVLTRAVEQLYVISKKDINPKGIVNTNTYAGMLITYLQNIGNWSDNQLVYGFGESDKKVQTIPNALLDPIELISVPKEDHDLSIITKSGLLWDTQQEKAIERGNLVHLILSKIKTKQDLDLAFNELLFEGAITNEQINQLKSVVISVLEHPKLKLYFEDGFDVYNERDIITNTGQLLRPDRLNINTLKDVILIDYKTGEKKSYHQSQLNDYDFVLKEMNYKVTKKILVYINESIEVIEV